MTSNPSHPPRIRQKTAAASKRPRLRMLYVTAISILLVLVMVFAYGLLERNLLRPRVDSTVEQTDMFVKAGEHIQINVINACGVDGIATKFSEFLRARRFDVPDMGTAAKLEPISRVIDRIGDPTSARKVAYALGIPPEHIDRDIDSSLYLRATVVIGGDYLTLRPMQ